MNQEIIKEWLLALYEDAISEAKATIANERMWEKGSATSIEASAHHRNIELQEEYIETLENLKRQI